MTYTLSIPKLGSTDELVNVDVFDRADLKVRATKETPKGFFTEYVLATGSAADEVMVAVNATYDPKHNGGEGRTSYTVTLTSKLVETDDVSGIVTNRGAIGSGFFFFHPGKGVEDSSLIRKLLGNAFGLSYTSVTSNEMNTAVIDDLGNFITEIH
jgi:hypothetical protein